MRNEEFTQERRARIARLIEENGRARVADLARLCQVSSVTIRKDLLRLEAEKRLLRTYGGAIAREKNRPEGSFEVRERLQQGEKASIGAAAAELVSDGESIALDASTTALQLVRSLKQRGGWERLTIVTNGLRIAFELAGHSGIRVVMPGGWVRGEALSLVGGLGDAVFDRVNVHRAFVGAAGFAIASGLSESTEEEAQIKRSMIAGASEVVALVDHTKWGRAAFATFCQTNRIAMVITDTAAPAAMIESLKRLGVETRRVPPAETLGARTAGQAATRP